jgi:hypothetical protein
LEADISIWQKTGHFYFALTAAFYEAQHRHLQINHLKWKAAKLGFKVIEASAA